MTVFLDTNVLVYAFEDSSKADIADGLLSAPFIIGVQSLNEFTNVLTRKLKMSWPETFLAIGRVEAVATTVLSTELQDFRAALSIGQRYQLSIYDALMLAIALRAGCETFYSQDMHSGLVIDNQLTITNPFA